MANNSENCCSAVQHLEPTEWVTPRTDIIEEQEGVTLVLDMPGVTQSGLEVTMEKGVLTITGQPADEEIKGLDVLHREYATGTYRRSFVLSDDLDSDKIDAVIDLGVLTLRIPKSERVKPRKIQIKSVH